MIKVPATQAGIPAIATLIGEGININVTLLFANDNYEQVAEAYIEGLGSLCAARAETSAASLRSPPSLSAAWTPSWTRRWKQSAMKIYRARSPSPTPKSPTRFIKICLATIVGRRSGRPGRPAPAPAVGQHQHEKSGLSRHDVRRRTDRTGNRQHRPPGYRRRFQDHGTVEITLTVDVDEARDQLAQLAALGIDLDEID